MRVTNEDGLPIADSRIEAHAELVAEEGIGHDTAEMSEIRI